jgi:hypothetical protein
MQHQQTTTAEPLPWMDRDRSLPARWLATLVACLTRPRQVAAGLRSGTTLGALWFVLLSAWIAAPLVVGGLYLKSHQSERALPVFVAIALLGNPLQAVFSALYLSGVFWIVTRFFGAHGHFAPVFRGYLYTLGYLVLFGPTYLPLGSVEFVAIGMTVGATLLTVLVQLRLLVAFARHELGLSIPVSVAAASIAYIPPAFLVLLAWTRPPAH